MPDHLQDGYGNAIPEFIRQDHRTPVTATLAPEHHGSYKRVQMRSLPVPEANELALDETETAL